MEIIMGPTFSGGNPTGITSVHSDIIHNHILTKLDGPTLTSTASTCSHLQFLCAEKNLWKNICKTCWPSINTPHVQNIISSFPSTHKSFFSDSFPTPDHHHNPTQWSKPNKKIAEGVKQELTSLVDVHFGNQSVYSKVIVTKNKTGWFSNSSVRIDVVEENEIVPVPVKFDGEEGNCMKVLEEEMKLSWIVIDPIKKRAVNLSSHTPLEIRRHWMCPEYIEVIYGIVVAGAGVEGGFARYCVTVTCGGKEGGKLHVKHICMQVEDMSGQLISGKDSLVILLEAMDGKRVKREIEEQKKRHTNFLQMRGICRENKQKRERRSEMICIVCCILFVAYLIFILYAFISLGGWR